MHFHVSAKYSVSMLLTLSSEWLLYTLRCKIVGLALLLNEKVASNNTFFVVGAQLHSEAALQFQLPAMDISNAG